MLPRPADKAKPPRSAEEFGRAFDELTADLAALERALDELRPRVARDRNGPLRRVATAINKAKGQIEKAAAGLVRDVQALFPGDERLRGVKERVAPGGADRGGTP